MTGNLNFGNNKTINIASPINALDVTNKQYVEAVTNDFLSRGGESVDGILYIDNNLIRNERTPLKICIQIPDRPR